MFLCIPCRFVRVIFGFSVRKQINVGSSGKYSLSLSIRPSLSLCLLGANTKKDTFRLELRFTFRHIQTETQIHTHLHKYTHARAHAHTLTSHYTSFVFGLLAAIESRWPLSVWQINRPTENRHTDSTQKYTQTLTSHGTGFVFGLVAPRGQVCINVVHAVHTLEQFVSIHNHRLRLTGFDVMKHHLFN